MSVPSWIRSWKNRLTRRGNRTPIRKRRATARPRLESLEDRTTPSAGALDPTFGVGGLVLTHNLVGDGDLFGRHDVAIQADGKIIRAGDSLPTTIQADYLYWSITLTRYAVDGTVDSSFGGSGPHPGFVVLDLAGTPSSDVYLFHGNFLVSMALQADGKIVLYGFLTNYPLDSGTFVARLNSDGTLDGSFGTNGHVFLDSFGSAGGFVPGVFPLTGDMAIQGDGKIVLSNNVFSQTGADNFAVTRLNGNGTLDSSFGNGGTQSIDFGTTGSECDALTIQPDGKILVGGSGGGNVGADALARLNGDGSPDTSFGPNHDGKLVLPPAAGADSTNGFWDLTTQPDGKIVGLGDYLVNGADAPSVARLNSDGGLDTSFGSAGRQTLIGAGYTPSSVAVAPDGKIVVAGCEDGAPIHASRLNSDGSLDGSFGTNGTTVFSSANAGPIFPGIDVAIQADGNILVSGTAHDPDVGGLTVARLLGGAMDVTTQAAVTSQLSKLIATANLSGEQQKVTFQVAVQADVDTMLAAVNALPAATTDVTIAIDLGGGAYSTNGVALNPPAGVHVVIQNGTLDPSSPALTVAGGAVTVQGCTLFTTGDSPTIVVTGGHLTLRNDVVQESTGFADAAISITGGTVDLGTGSDPGGNTLNVNGPGAYVLNATATPVAAVGTAFTVNGAPFQPGSLSGLVWIDFNNDGQVDLGENPIAGVTVALTGTDDLGHVVSQITQTDANGIYAFTNLRPSNGAGYTITETQPAGFLEGKDALGTVNGVPTGSAAVQDVLSGIVLPATSGAVGENYNFGERPTTTGAVSAGQTAGIGFWQNNKGQNLIQSLNGGSTATQLGHWLAVTFPNIYASLDGKTNAGVAAFYKQLFARTAQTAPAGPPKVDAQVMATALAVFVTNQSLAGTTAATYGFQVTATGVGTRTFNVGSDGGAFGIANNSVVSVLDLLLAVNARSHNGVLYDLNGNGLIDSTEASYRTIANDIFTAINEAGSI
jgi:uncharacterized delta-60 repeat protein